MPALETLSAHFFLTKTVDEIADWLHAQRVRTGETLYKPQDYADLRRQFGQLSHRWHPILTDDRLRASHRAAIHQAAVRALDISKLIYHELEHERQGLCSLAPESALRLLVELNSLLLDRVSAQLDLLESTGNYAEELHEATLKLVLGQTISPAGFISLARRIQWEMRSRPAVAQWMPLPGVKLSEGIAPRTWLSEAEVYATGIQAARLIAWYGSHQPQLADRLELLIVAALLQDIGFLRLERQTRKPPSELEVHHQATYRRHPSLGAGLAAGVGGYSIELSFLIAQHHERLDGTGYPHGLSRYKQSQDAQLLASLVRFQELLSHQPEGASSLEAACAQAGFQLFLESAQGAWNAAAVRNLLDALDAELPLAADQALATGQPFVADEFWEKRWARHPGEATVPAPHFLFSRPHSARPRQQTSRDDHKIVRHDPQG